MILFLLVFSASLTEAKAFTGLISGTVETEGIANLLSFEGNHFSSINFELGLESHLDYEGYHKHNPRWALNLKPSKNSEITIKRNHEHFTSPDTFRLIKDTNFLSKTRLYSLRYGGIHGAILKNVPFKSLDSVDVLYLAGNIEINSASFRVTELKYAGLKESGSARVLEMKVDSELMASSVAMGWQEDTKGDVSKGFISEIALKGKKLNGSLEWRQIHPGFRSLFSENEKHAKNRRGYHLTHNAFVGNLKISANFRRHQNMEGTRQYNQHSWTISAKDKHTEVEWRLEPTTAFILRYEKDKIRIQLDAWNASLRYANRYGGLNYDLRADGKHGIFRWQLGSGQKVRWRAIGKYDLNKKRTHHSVFVIYELDKATFQLELGKYDRGNILAGFHDSPQFCISWGYEF